MIGLRERCRSCGLAECSNVPLGLYGNPRGTALVLTDCPSMQEGLMGNHHRGPLCQRMDDLLAQAGLALHWWQVPYTYAAKCHPDRPGNTPRVHEVETCASVYLRFELEHFRPDLIMCWGKVAYRGLYAALQKARAYMVRPQEYQYDWYCGIDIPTATGRPLIIVGLPGLRAVDYRKCSLEDYARLLQDVKTVLIEREYHEYIEGPQGPCAEEAEFERTQAEGDT